MLTRIMMTKSVIFIQKTGLTSRRTGSPSTMPMPEMNRTSSDHFIHGR